MYEWLKFAYPLRMATLQQCKQVVIKGKITPEQYKEITGEVYV